QTVVRVALPDDTHIGRLQEEMRTFPAEFLLFFPTCTCVTLQEVASPARVIRVSVADDAHDVRVLHDGEGEWRWRVVHRDVAVTEPRAVEDATHIHARTTVPVAWATPLETRREEAGRFWAFFPTHTATYLPGILNAPWKVNNDRDAVIGG